MNLSNQSLSSYSSRRFERPHSSHLYGFYPALVRGSDVRGRRFHTTGSVTHLSADSLHLLLLPQVARGTRLFIVVHLVRTLEATVAIPRVACLGTVYRVDQLPHGILTVELDFSRFRFLQTVRIQPAPLSSGARSRGWKRGG